MPVLQTGDPGAIPGESTFHNEYSQRHGPVVQRRRLLVHVQATMVQFHPGSISRGPRYANGRAARLKPERVQVRLLPWAQTVIHLAIGVCRGAESSSPCHGEDRGFKSRQTRWSGTVRKLEKRRSSNLRDFAGSTPAHATGNTRRLSMGVLKWL